MHSLEQQLELLRTIRYVLIAILLHFFKRNYGEVQTVFIILKVENVLIEIISVDK